MLPAAAVAAVVAPLLRCADPTAVDVLVYSEVPCSANARAALAGASAAGDLGGRPPSGTSAECTPDLAPMNALGHVVLTPSASKDGTVAFAVMQRPDGASPDDCLDPAKSKGCIVAKRWLRYRPEADVPIRVDLRLSCESVSCPADQTCVKGVCRPLTPSDATACPSEDGCAELNPTCAGGTEVCNLSDDNCNGKCDDLDGCRVSVFESIGYGNLGYCGLYTTNATTASSGGYAVKTKDFFFVYRDQQPGTVPLVRCTTKKSSFIDHACAPGTFLETLGYVAETQVCGSVPVYRANLGWDHILTLDPSTNGSLPGIYWVNEGVFGYVWRTPRD